MTIILSPETEARLRERAEQQGQDVNTLANALLTAALEWEAQDYAEAVAGIQRGLDAGAAGRVRPADEVFADMRTRWAGVHETTLLSEVALAEDWNRPEEDAAWSHLQRLVP